MAGRMPASAGLGPRLLSWLYGSSLYAATLNGRMPRAFTWLPAQAGAGDEARGRDILAGALPCGAFVFDSRQPQWFEASAGDDALAALHSFDYLADLAVVGDPARTCAQQIVTSWITHASDWDPIAWAPEVIGTRLCAWLAHARFLSPPDGDFLEGRMLASLARQARHLSRTVTGGRNGLARLEAIKGLLFAALCGVADRRSLSRALGRLRDAISFQIGIDGVHIERSPTAQYRALSIFVDIRTMLTDAGLDVPAYLSQAIAASASGLRGMRHGDGGLALFNGSTEGSPKAVADVLKQARADATPTIDIAVSSVQYVAANSTILIQDAGAPPSPGFDKMAHAGTLSFEMSSGEGRVIVNCGSSSGPVGDALRTTAAHSTLVIEDVNSSQIVPGDGLGTCPPHVECARDMLDGNVWVTTSHDGYSDRFGLVHRRRIYVAAAGDNVRGEDALIPSGSENPAGRTFAVRFHLHPDVRASLVQSGAAVLLSPPFGTGWRLQCSGGIPRLEESVYYGDGKNGRRTHQVLIAATTQSGGATVKWALQKIGREPH